MTTIINQHNSEFRQIVELLRGVESLDRDELHEAVDIAFGENDEN